jgi:TolB-like protein/Flp pilus assembly protein TadD
MRCMRKTAGERFQTMAEIKVALETISEKPAQLQPSIAVLPFADMSRDADDEYFSDGLADEIINALTQVAGLKVIARTSAFAFKGKNEDIRRIAEALGVTSVLEGSVRRAGNRLRVTAQLIHAADGTHLWSQRYDREMTDIFAVQDEIAAAIAGTLQVKLTGKPVTTRTFEPNLPAYEAFLRGRQQSYKLSPEAHSLAEEHFKQAITLDPQWADPHSYLGRVYFSLGFYGLRPSPEMVVVARAEARKALELLPSEPIAHALLGIIAASYDYDWKEAEEQFGLARASEPLPPYVHDMRAHFYLLPLGRFEEALQERMKAIAQDPLNALWRAHQAFTLLCAEMYELAVVEARKALELDDRIYVAHWVVRWHITVMQRSNDSAVRERELPIPVGLERYLVAQDGAYTVEVACFMGRGDPFPVAVPVRDFGNEGRAPTRVSCCRGKEGDKAGHCCHCSQDECEVFHKRSSIQNAYMPRAQVQF